MQVYIASHYLIICDIFPRRHLTRTYREKMPHLQDIMYQFFLIIRNMKDI